jgi:hypothetical protein
VEVDKESGQTNTQGHGRICARMAFREAGAKYPPVPRGIQDELIKKYGDKARAAGR